MAPNLPNAKIPSNASLGSPTLPIIYSSLRDLGRYDQMISGHTYLLDLVAMTLTDQTANTPPVSLSGADQRLRGRVMSMFIFTSDADSLINLNNNTLFNDHSLYHVINNINVQQITIVAPSNKVPGLIDLNFVISTSPKMDDVYVKDLQLVHTKKFITNQNTTNGFADILRIHMGGYDQMTVALNENNVNDVQYQVLVSEDDVNYYILPGMGFPATITKGSYALFTTIIKWHFYRIQVADKVAGTHGQLNMQCSPIR